MLDEIKRSQIEMNFQKTSGLLVLQVLLLNSKISFKNNLKACQKEASREKLLVNQKLVDKTLNIQKKCYKVFVFPN